MAEPTTRQWEEIQKSLFHHRRTEAAKLYHYATGCSKDEAIGAIWQLEEQLKRESPERFKSQRIALQVILAGFVFPALALLIYWFFGR